MTGWQSYARPHDAGRAMNGRNEFDRPGADIDFSRRLSLRQPGMIAPLEATVWLHHSTREPVWLQVKQTEAIDYLARRRRTGDWVERLWDWRGQVRVGLREVDRLDQLWAITEYPSILELLPGLATPAAV